MLHSLGSSTGSSCCGSLLEQEEEEEEEGTSTDDELKVGGTDHQEGVAFVAGGEGGSGTRIEFTDVDSGTSLDGCLGAGLGGRGRRCNGLLRRTSDGTLYHGLLTNRRHAILQKSKSLNAGGEEEGEEGRGDHVPPHPHADGPISRACLYSSAQTLVPEDDVTPCGDQLMGGRGGGGGDSGIDPGDVEVFQFPPSTDENHTPDHTPTTILDPQGDNTPICTSPHLNHSPLITEYATPTTTSEVGMAGPGRWREVGGFAPRSSPTHSGYSFSRTSSEELMMDYDSRNLATPSEHCLSPTGQSWTSSEFSFSLPTPSTPWAPPSSPMPPHPHSSLPTSPSHYHQHHFTPQQRPHRKSHDAGVASRLSSCLRKTSSSSRPHSCRNSALFLELGGDPGPDARKLLNGAEDFKKCVHFVESDRTFNSDHDYIDYEGFASMGGAIVRPRSKSTPQNQERLGLQRMSAHEMLGGAYEGEGEEGVIRLRSDWFDQDPHSCKCYNIAQQSHTRLSNSAPDLSKLMIAVPSPPSSSSIAALPPRIRLNGSTKHCS